MCKLCWWDRVCESASEVWSSSGPTSKMWCTEMDGSRVGVFCLGKLINYHYIKIICLNSVACVKIKCLHIINGNAVQDCLSKNYWPQNLSHEIFFNMSSSLIWVGSGWYRVGGAYMCSFFLISNSTPWCGITITCVYPLWPGTFCAWDSVCVLKTHAG